MAEALPCWQKALKGEDEEGELDRPRVEAKIREAQGALQAQQQRRDAPHALSSPPRRRWSCPRPARRRALPPPGVAARAAAATAWSGSLRVSVSGPTCAAAAGC